MAPLFTGLRLSFGRSAAEVAGPSPISATGGTTNTYSDGGINYKSHVFTYPNSDNFIVTAGFDNVEYLVVAGGGGGANSNGGGGGGGGGGLLSNYPGVPAPLRGSPLTLSVGTYPVTVGAGGASQNGAASPSDWAKRGGTSSFNAPSPISATGGGAGSESTGNPERPGGSGGGGSYNAGGGTATSGQGNDGGPGHGGGGSPAYGGGGGGGAGGTGTAGTPSGGGHGGVGLRVIIAGPNPPYGTPGPGPTTGGWFAGGGGGGHYNGSGSAGTGGSGGGANGGTQDTRNHATSSTGGGGGGSGGEPTSFVAGNGGPGIVIVRYVV